MDKIMFTNREETYRYLKLLGATQDADVYVLDGMGFRYLNYYDHLLFYRDDLDEEIQKKIRTDNFLSLHPWDNEYGIQSLDDLVYLHGLLNEVDTYADPKVYAKLKTKELIKDSLKLEIKEKENLFKGPTYPCYPLDENYKKFLNNLTNLINVIYPINLLKTERDITNFIGDTTFHTISSDDKHIHFEWTFITDYGKNEDDNKDINCQYIVTPNLVMAQITYNYGDNGGIDTINYLKDEDSEEIVYNPAPIWGGMPVAIDLKKNWIKKGEKMWETVSDEDYEIMNRLVVEFYTGILNRLPYLNKGIINTKGKRKIKR